MKSSLEAPEKQIAEETTAKPAAASVIDTSKMSAGKAAPFIEWVARAFGELEGGGFAGRHF